MTTHLSYDKAIEQVKERLGNRELSDAAALTLCAAWQSPGIVGWALAAVSTGAWSPESLRDDSLAVITGQPVGTRGEVFRTDLWRTFKDEPAEIDVWSMLGTWSMNGGDND